MKKKLLLVALSLVFSLCAVLGLNVAAKDVSAKAETNVIASVTGDASGFVTDEEWAGITPINFTGANEGTVKLATVGTNLFFLYELKDTTKFIEQDRFAYTIETNGVKQEQQGHFNYWLTGSTFNPVQTEFAYDDAAQKYVVEMGIPFGDKLIPGTEVKVTFEHNDVTTADGAWGSGDHSAASATLKFAVEAEEPAPVPSTVIAAVKGDENGFVTADEWAAIVPYTGTGANQMTVKLATVGNNFFFLYEVKDVTKFTGKDRIAYIIETNGAKQEQQGNFDPWLTPEPSFGPNVQTEFSYDETAQKYVVLIGIPLGENLVPGAEVKVLFVHNDVTTADQSWGAGEETKVEATLTFQAPIVEEPEQPEEPAVPSTVIAAVKGDENGFVTADEWAAIVPYTGTGANQMTVKLATVGNNFFFLYEVKDVTKFTGKDRIAYIIETNGAKQEQQGNFDPWLTPEPSFGPNVQTEFSYDETAQKYVVLIGIPLGENFVPGAEVKVVFVHNDVTTADQSWGAGEETKVEATLTFAGEYVEEPEIPEEPVVPNYTYVLPVIDFAPGASSWELAEKYALTTTAGTTGATGYVSLLVSGTHLYVKMVITDETRFGNDRPDYKIVIGGKTASARGKYIDDIGAYWLADRTQDFGKTLVHEATYENNVYELTLAFNIGDYAVEGAHVEVYFSHADAQKAEDEWDDSEKSYPHAISFSGVLYIGKYSETDPVAPEQPEEPDTPVDPEEPETPVDPEPTPGPENTDLDITVIDLPGMPDEKMWAKLPSYQLIANNGNITGAYGKIQICTAATNIFFRLEVTDPTFHKIQDAIYIFIGTEELNLETRGNFDMWLAHINNSFGSPSLLEQTTANDNLTAYKENTVVFKYGMYIPDIYAVGEEIRICIKYRDSRSAAEPWPTDNDQKHTIYFDQTVTFGPAADLTVRPEEVTEGFNAGNEQVSYNKANIVWSDVANAETYKMFIYKVNADGAEEPYTHVATEGPVYAGIGNFSEVIEGLTEKTAYAVQVIAYDKDGEIVACSSLTAFTTISRQEAMDSANSSSIPEESSKPEEPETPAPAEGCFAAAGVSTMLAVVLGFAAFKALKRKED